MAEIGTEIVSTLPPEEEGPSEPIINDSTHPVPPKGGEKSEAEKYSEKQDKQDHMGNCCGSACGGERNEGDEDEQRWLLGKGNDGGELPEKYQWEQDVMENNVMKSGQFSHAIIVSVDNGELRAVAPRDFRPEKKAIKNILAALKEGDTAGIAEDGINLGGGSNVSTPGKLDEGKAIYASDGKGGGCAVFRTKETVLICVYPAKPAVSTRLAAEVAEYIEDEGGR